MRLRHAQIRALALGVAHGAQAVGALLGGHSRADDMQAMGDQRFLQLMDLEPEGAGLGLAILPRRLGRAQIERAGLGLDRIHERGALGVRGIALAPAVEGGFQIDQPFAEARVIAAASGA